MSNKGLVFAAAKAIAVANDVEAGSPYRAELQCVPVGITIPARRNEAADTLLFVEHGTLEVTIEGAEGYLGAGEFARVPAGRFFAYRNAAGETALVLQLAVPRPARGTREITAIVATAAA